MIPLRDHLRLPGIPFVTIGLILINAYVFFLELTSLNFEGFLVQYALIPSLLDFSNPATLAPFITSMFLHGGWIHIISNMLFLWIFGDNIELTIGHIKFLIFYLLAGIAAALVQLPFLPSPDIPMLGASGAIAGVLGAYLVLFPHSNIDTLVPIFGFFSIVQIPASVMLFYWFITQLFSGAASLTSEALGGVAFLAHVGGFVFGYLGIRYFQPKNNLTMEK